VTVCSRIFSCSRETSSSSRKQYRDDRDLQGRIGGLQGWVVAMASVMVCLATFAAGCQATPVREGASITLPQPRERVLVVGNHPGVVSTGITWLERHGLVVAAPGIVIFMPDQTLFDQAKALQARSLVWVQLTGDSRAPMVAVQGFDPETEAVLWTGHAQFSSYDSRPLQHEAARLTCHAFAAIWKTAEGPPCP
jgi:hypothetical protein